MSSGLVDPSVLSRPQSLTQLTCSYDTENQTRYLSCDLGNPMKSGTSVRTRLFFWHLMCHREFLKAAVRGAPRGRQFL